MKKIKVHGFMIVDVLLLIAVSLFVAGCAGITPQEQRARDSVTKARAALEEAKANPQIASAASVLLYEAEQTLKAAELVEDDAAKKEHLAYMSERKTQLAVVSAERTLAERDVLNLSNERDQLILQRREKEISKAKLTAKEKAAALEKARMEVKQKAATVTQLKAELEELKARPTDRGMVVTLGDILFATNRATLTPGAEKNIDQLSQFMKKYPTRKIVIEGHTDSVGRSEYNLTLSKRRADEVKKALVAKDIDESRIETKGYGETTPLASNKTAAGRQQNRRVEVIILEDDQSPK
jgi:outer membrane protein OmpA-like peptidoglycan-associated protein